MTTIPQEVTLTHNQRAEQIIASIRSQVEGIEGYGHLPADRRRKVAGYSANITDAELNAAAMACDAHPQLAAAAGMTGDEFRDAIGFCAANTKLMAEMELDRGAIGHAVKLKRAVLASRARLVYQAAQNLNKPVDMLIPHIEMLRQLFSRPKRRTATGETPAPPTTTTPPASSTSPPASTEPKK
ncbi:MAG: hypothetical protein QOJ98_2130 [Acidobacteriota bacterium]|jgi:hypothetical protein|nr:hypothetical protein [Acidobacteriota bacterium]